MVDAPKNAVPIGTVAGVQLPAVLKSELPGAADQVASWAQAGMAATNAAAAVVANKYARIPLAPAAEFLNADLACSLLSMWGRRQVSSGSVTTIVLRPWFPRNI